MWPLPLSRTLKQKRDFRVWRQKMQKFDFIFGVCLGELVLRHGDELSIMLQKIAISASEGMELCQNVTVTAIS